MAWKWVGIGGKGYANTSYISKFRITEKNRASVTLTSAKIEPNYGQYMDLVSIPIESDRFSVRMGRKWDGIDGKGYANTTYISEFHPHIPKT